MAQVMTVPAPDTTQVHLQRRPQTCRQEACCFQAARDLGRPGQGGRLLPTSSAFCMSCAAPDAGYDADLVHADLHDADLSGAELQRASLGQARLDGADLSEADLSFTSLRGASAWRRSARQSAVWHRSARRGLSGALLDTSALEQSHWQGATGIQTGIRSHAALHNAGVDAAQKGRWPDAERLFSAAILENPDEPLSWVARGLSRGEQGKHDLAAKDLSHAGSLFAAQGDQVKADQLELASQRVYDEPEQNAASGNGMGSALLSGALSAAQALAPIALKALMPMIP